ncbi:oligosaccharide flippase family protein [Phaeovulum sp.]|uniref:oligosaccharide flippase family protein n=1 Tax=Phaeovulum sp. TaxID=2934796 RepID=UPI0039E3A444
MNTTLNSSHPNRQIHRFDAHDREIFRGAVVAFVLRGIGAGLAFALNIVIARLLGAEGAGPYFIALSVTVIGSVIVRVGLDNSLLRFVSAGVALQDWGRVRSVFRLAMGVTLASSGALALGLMVFAAPLAAQVFDRPALVGPLRYAGAAIVSFSIMSLLSEALKGLKLIGPSMLVAGALYPLFGLVLIWPMVHLLGPDGASATYFVATALAAAVGWWFWRRGFVTHDTPAVFGWAELWDSCRPLWLMSVVTRAILPWAPVFLLGFWGSGDQAGIFGAATRVALLVSFLLVSVNTILAPKLSELFVRDEVATLRRLANRMTLGLCILTSPLFALLIFQGSAVMRLFGPEFAQGGAVLAILAVGQAVTVASGAAGQILMMTGNERIMGDLSLGACAVLLGLSWLLIPAYGMVGAAIANAVCMAVVNLGALLFSARVLAGMHMPEGAT